MEGCSPGLGAGTGMAGGQFDHTTHIRGPVCDLKSCRDYGWGEKLNG